MLKAAEACHKGGNPFGIGLGTTEDRNAGPLPSRSRTTVGIDKLREDLRELLKFSDGGQDGQEAESDKSCTEEEKESCEATKEIFDSICDAGGD